MNATPTPTSRAIFLRGPGDRPPRTERAAYLDGPAAATPACAAEVEALLRRTRRHAGAELPERVARPGRRPSMRRPSASGPATVIGPYKLLEQIGEGGFGRRLHGRADRTRSAARSP